MTPEPGRTLVILYAMILVPVGLGVALLPDTAMALLGGDSLPADPALRGELRALGIMEAGAGWLGWHLRDDLGTRPDLRRALVTVYALFPAARVLGLLLDGSPGTPGLVAIVFETLFAVGIGWGSRPRERGRGTA